MTEPNQQALNSKRDMTVHYEQTKLLFNAMPTSVWGTILAAAILAAIFWEIIDHSVLISWLLIINLVTLARGIHTYAFWKAAPSAESIASWFHQFTVGSIAAGLAWGATAIWLFPIEHPVYQIVLAFMLTATCAVAITSLASLRLPLISFLLVTLLPLAVRFQFTGTDVGQIMAIMLSILILLLSVSGLRVYRTTLDNITLRLDAQSREDELRNSQQHLALHIQRTPLAVIEWNTDFEVAEWNPAAEKIFGYTRAEALGRSATDFIVPSYARKEIENIWQQLLNKEGGLHSTNENITKDGRTILCEWYNTPLIDEKGNAIGAASLTQDVTDRIRVEKLKSEFVSVVSHELRTPLTSIRGSLGLILGGATGPISDKPREMLNIANNNAQRLLLIINDILDIEKIESGKLEYKFQALEIMPLLEQAVSANTGYAVQYDVHLVITEINNEVCVWVDPDRIIQVLNNLISNAIKFSPKGETVELSITANDGRVRVAVSDHGPGIPEEFHTKLFDKFTQLDASDKRYAGGTGLGLSIAKSIIEHHQGVIDFETTEGTGTTFYFELPEYID